MSSIYTRQDGTRVPIRKRKEPQPFDPPLNPIPVKPISAKVAQPAHPAHPAQVAKLAKPVEPNNHNNDNNNKLLAGYLAHEFLTKGTLLGKRFEPGKVELNPVHQAGPSKPGNSYKEVSYLLKADGVHIPGVVNPTQLGRWLQKWECHVADGCWMCRLSWRLDGFFGRKERIFFSQHVLMNRGGDFV